MTKFFPYVGPFIIFLGVERLLIYYTHFGINILGFLSFSEIITSFFDIIFVIVTMIAVGLIHGFVSASKTTVNKISTIKRRVLPKLNFWKRLILYVKLHDDFIIYMLGNLGATFLLSFFDSKITSYTYLIVVGTYLALFIFIIVMDEIRLKHREFDTPLEFRRMVTGIVYGLLFIIMVGFMTMDEISKVETHKKYLNTQISLDDGRKIISDSTNYYIGNTQSYLFIYHEKNQITDVIPMSSVTEMRFYKKKRISFFY